MERRAHGVPPRNRVDQGSMRLSLRHALRYFAKGYVAEQV